ncbi:hypothetical protein LX32DRAFT_398047 [Colletotrichum zoysiae]|uniref:Uncharacterized protein n=1 Tax=Colletotrichum zoysiae TaxID=1216348 RepID=A0AAD9HT25_9PEZI|nr:hypothetical protein LX32DRAFT_398047 [Colletotrichum zoysiae]
MPPRQLHLRECLLSGHGRDAFQPYALSFIPQILVKGGPRVQIEKGTRPACLRHLGFFFLVWASQLREERQPSNMAKDALPISVAMFLNMGSPRRDGSGSCETLPKTQDSRCTGQRPGKTQTHTHIPNSHAHVMAVERKMQARVVFYFYFIFIIILLFPVPQPFGCTCGRRRESLLPICRKAQHAVGNRPWRCWA